MERALEILVLVGVTWPLLRLCLSRVFIHKMRWFRGLAAALIVAFGLYFAAITAAAMHSPFALRIMASVALVIALCILWRARPSYGRSRGLPPGSLALAPLGPWVDHLHYQKGAERYGPVFKMSRFVEPMVCIVGLDTARTLLRDHDDDLIVPPLPFTRLIPRGFLRYMPPSDHRAYAALFRTAFAGSVIQDREPAIAQIIRDKLAQLAQDSAARDDVFPRPYLSRIMFAVCIGIFFGVEPDSEDFATLQRAYEPLRSTRAWYRSARAARDGLVEIEMILRRQIARCTTPGEAPRCFLAEAVRAHPGGELDRTAICNFTYILLTASGDVTGLLHWILEMLSDHPQWMARLRAELDSADPSIDPDGIAERTVRETLRLEQSEYLMRRARRTIRWNSFVIPRRWLVRICVRESHRSADVFDHADTFDPDRFLRRRIGSSEFSPFGMTRLSCLGEALTMIVARIFVRELASGFDMTTLEDGPREFVGFHWRPSSRLRVRLTARQPAARAELTPVLSAGDAGKL